MLSCLKLRKKTDNKKLKVTNKGKQIKANKGKLMILSKYAVCNSQKSRFIKNQKARMLLSSLRLKISLSKIPLLSDSDILFLKT